MLVFKPFKTMPRAICIVDPICLGLDPEVLTCTQYQDGGMNILLNVKTWGGILQIGNEFPLQWEN
mgnify:CR=1 FL=1